MNSDSAASRNSIHLSSVGASSGGAGQSKGSGGADLLVDKKENRSGRRTMGISKSQKNCSINFFESQDQNLKLTKPWDTDQREGEGIRGEDSK